MKKIIIFCFMGLFLSCNTPTFTKKYPFIVKRIEIEEGSFRGESWKQAVYYDNEHNWVRSEVGLYNLNDTIKLY